MLALIALGGIFSAAVTANDNVTAVFLKARAGRKIKCVNESLGLVKCVVAKARCKNKQ
jgi:hypothetical protein